MGTGRTLPGRYGPKCPRFGFITGKKGSGVGHTHTHTETRVTEQTVVIKIETRRWLTLLVPQGQVRRLDRAVDKGRAPGSLSPGKDIQA